MDEAVDALVAAALAEDVGDGDRTTAWTVEGESRCRAAVLARETLVVAGSGIAERVFRAVDPELDVRIVRGDGERVDEGAVVLRLEGRTRGLLTAERTALNFLGRLSGIATLTRRFVEAAEGCGARITDTRKTTPGWRRLEKAAVRAGGGTNHRMGLDDMVLVKENHIAAAGGIAEALRRVGERNREGLPVEVEVESLAQLDEVRQGAVDRILLDNLEVDEVEEAVRRVRSWPEPRPELEASGRMTLERVASVAATGVDWISVGALTHSASSADFSLLVER